jgi:N-acetylglucosamine kinase-like BadF-type ATPase
MSIQLIADSGSTKTDWRLTSGSAIVLQHQTEGFNPYYMAASEIVERLKQNLIPALNSIKPDFIHFYGAGCSAQEKSDILSEALSALFPNATIHIHSDMLGAAHALCGRRPGMAAILGTGSNSCLYDGRQIVHNRPSLGFILGDEGSGAYIGKELIRLFLYDEMEEGLKVRFGKRFSITTSEVLEHVYRRPLPNRYMAGYSKFIFRNIDHPQCLDIVANSFRAFFKHHILRYEYSREWPLHVTGSVGFYYSNILRRVADEQHLQIGTITETPIAGLTLYHLEEE